MPYGLHATTGSQAEGFERCLSRTNGRAQKITQCVNRKAYSWNRSRGTRLEPPVKTRRLDTQGKLRHARIGY